MYVRCCRCFCCLLLSIIDSCEFVFVVCCVLLMVCCFMVVACCALVFTCVVFVVVCCCLVLFFVDDLLSVGR